MDNENNWKPLWDDEDMQEFEGTIAIYNDFTRTNMNLISNIQEQLKRNTQLASLMIICFIVFGLNFLCMLSDTTNSITEFEPRKERRRQELMEYLVHTERSRDIIRMGPEAFIQFRERIRQPKLLRMYIVQQLKNKLLNFFILLDITSKIEVFHFFFIGLEEQFLVTFTTY